ncbi:MAG: SpoIIE family protein phosphatase [Leptospiraceae bacterium]|nr:SpoIIE family protein phosphatase [Leptospiraceae bacterium]MCP5494085.1 SpoIIE family protein phosphatase [Leptospiraceae bacterium]
MSFEDFNSLLNSATNDDFTTMEKPLVMVVDDNYVTICSLEAILLPQYRVVLCIDGNEGIKKITKDVYAVILDIKMHGMDGFETFLKIKEKSPNVPIIFYSAYQELKDPFYVMNRYRPFGYIKKGTVATVLLDTVASAVEFYKSTLHNELLIKELAEAKESLEEKVKERTKQLAKKNEELNKLLFQFEQTNKLLSASNKKIMDSIHYAHRIQTSMLPNLEILEMYLPESFVIWEPKDMVGGDFYQFYPVEDGFILIVADCTGHGVPGGFMTMLSISVLHRIIEGDRITTPGSILMDLNKIIKTSLQQDQERGKSDDGLESAVCYIQPKEKKLYFSGAKFSLNIAQDGEITKIKGERKSLGYKRSQMEYYFPTHLLSIEDGMTFYLYSDGIVDQLGGERNMPFGEKKLYEIIKRNFNRPLLEQKEEILEALQKYQKEFERLDDITMIGFRVGV